jgi:hypothetical protein
MLEPAETPETVRELARACEEYVRQSLGFQLDYSVETLPVLDEYAREVRATVEERPELLPLLARSLGAYFGEVLCRSAPGFWRLPSENIADWQVCLTNAFVWMNPIGAAYDALSGDGQHDGPGSSLRVAPEDRELVRERLGRLPDVDEEEYYKLSTRMEVIDLVVEELRRNMEQRGYGDSTFDASDYEGEQRPPVG